MSFDKRNLALPVIIAVATIITMNAVVGQDGKHPAPLGSDEQHQKITKPKKSVIDSRILKRKSRPPNVSAVIPRKKPAPDALKKKGDGIGRLLSAVSENRKKPASAKSLESKKIRFVQTRLAQLGFYLGPVDGLLGQKTREAIRKFEDTRKIPVTGKISPALIGALSRSASFAALDLT